MGSEMDYNGRACSRAGILVVAAGHARWAPGCGCRPCSRGSCWWPSEQRGQLSAPLDAGRNGRGIDGGRPAWWWPDQDAAAGDLLPTPATSLDLLLPMPSTSPCRCCLPSEHPPIKSRCYLDHVRVKYSLRVRNNLCPWMYSDLPPHIRIVLHLVSA
jgi:hypothetical protein